MNNIHKRRMWLLTLSIIGLGIAATFIFYALKQNMNVFLAPSEIAAAARQPGYHFRLGGMVKPHSVTYVKWIATSAAKRARGNPDNDGLGVTFIVTDYKNEITVKYDGILPDLFREGKGVIAEGSLDKQGDFVATQVLAKHDENYMPKNMADRINQPKATS